ncbi:MAG: hypothetical protein M3P18_13430 [Actinomycetota bacterium]|nr:hypothetical protein [Actinomycetota bacterium]
MVPVQAAALLARPRCLSWLVALTLLVAFAAPAAAKAGGPFEQIVASGPPFSVPAVRLQVQPPRGWHATGRALVNLVAPRPVLTLASFSLAGLPTEVGDCPHAALQRRGSRGVLLVLFEERDEHYLNRFPPRPGAFRVHLSATGCYGLRGEELTFRSHGRTFYAFVSLGSAAPRDSVRLLEATLNSLRIAARRLHLLIFRDRNGGLAFAFPALWSATRTRLDAIVSPPQLVAVASYPLAVRPSKDSCPHAAVAQRPPDRVFVQLREEANHRTELPPPSPALPAPEAPSSATARAAPRSASALPAAGSTPSSASDHAPPPPPIEQRFAYSTPSTSRPADSSGAPCLRRRGRLIDQQRRVTDQ